MKQLDDEYCSKTRFPGSWSIEINGVENPKIPTRWYFRTTVAKGGVSVVQFGPFQENM